MVAPAVAAPLVIGLDVGGTKILSGLVDGDGNVLAEHEVTSPSASETGVLDALDAAVEALLDDGVVALGYGIPANLERETASLVNVFDPELTVVGGGFGAAAGDLLLEPASEAARREAVPPADQTLRIVPAQLGAEAGLVGAGLVAFEALDGIR
jgi:predicted NBD/HSP70 family sugar kinase